VRSVVLLGVIFCLDVVVLSFFLLLFPYWVFLLGLFIYSFHKTCCKAINPYGDTWINIDEVDGRRAWFKNPSMQRALLAK
jgi:hypothetical protein